MRCAIIIISLIVLLSFYSAQCEPGQIDINSASKEELTQIIYIGEDRANQMINIRPFESLDDIVIISGIGEIYLQKIKEQNLACVDEYSEEDYNKKEKIGESDIEILSDSKLKELSRDNDKETKEFILEKEESERILEHTTFEPIKLNPQNIKSETDLKKEEDKEESYAIYLFVAFVIVICLLLAIKKYKRKYKYKNEFE